MASLQILKYNLTPFSVSPSNFRRQSYLFCSEFKSQPRSRRFLLFQSQQSSKILVFRSCKISCKVQEGDNKTNGEEPPESLFMKELRKRGMTPTSLLEETNRSTYGDEPINMKEDYENSISNQRERSMALNSEGLEGLIPRAKLLLSVGGTFFLGFGPLILVTVLLFSALYIDFGSSFVHDASRTPITPPQYIDPYVLLEDERISQMAPLVN